MLHGFLHGFLLHIDNPLIHGYPAARRTTFRIIILIVTWMLDTHLRFTYHCTHACMVSVLLSYGSPFILHVLLFHVTVFMLYD